MCSKIGFVVLFAVVCAASALPHQQDTEKDLVNMINKIDNEKSLYLIGGLRVERVENGRAFGGAVAGETLVDRTERYFQNHELTMDFGDDEQTEETTEEAARAMEEGRTKKMRKMLLPLLIALKLKKSLIFKVLFLVVKFISIKALALSFLALLFAGSQFFKDLIAKKKDHVTTAYIAGAPAAEIVHSSDWNRSGQASAQELAYNYHLGQQGVF